MTKKSIRFFNDRETFMKGIDYSYYYEQSDKVSVIKCFITTVRIV